MKKLMMMLGILLPMPLFAADTPATLDTLRDQIASLTTTVNAMKQKIDDLRLGGAVGDIGAVKDTVTNQGVQVQCQHTKTKAAASPAWWSTPVTASRYPREPTCSERTYTLVPSKARPTL